MLLMCCVVCNQHPSLRGRIRPPRGCYLFVFNLFPKQKSFRRALKAIACASLRRRTSAFDIFSMTPGVAETDALVPRRAGETGGAIDAGGACRPHESSRGKKYVRTVSAIGGPAEAEASVTQEETTRRRGSRWGAMVRAMVRIA